MSTLAHRWLLAGILLIFGASSMVGAPPQIPPPPELVLPEAFAQIPQNDPTTGCALAPGSPKRGHGFKIEFDWADVPRATQYRLIAKLDYATEPMVDVVVKESRYTHVACNLFTVGTLTGWFWQVETIAGDFAGDFSDPRPFSFFPCKLPDGTVCNITPGPYPDPVRILVDASRDGGSWWSPQTEQTGFDSAAPHHGKGLADYLRARGFVVDELPRGAAISDAALVGYGAVIRAGFGPKPYTPAEMTAYDKFLSGSGTLWLSCGQNPMDDVLAASLGLTLSPQTTPGTISKFAQHDLVHGVKSLAYGGGCALKGDPPPGMRVLGTVDGAGVMAVVVHPTAKVFFLADLTALSTVQQPLMNNLIAWSF
jgi:hypothetical protein